MREGGAGDADHAEDVHVEDAVPFLVVVVLDRALGADARVVDHHVESAEVGDGGGDGLSYGRVVGDVGAVAEQRLLDGGGSRSSTATDAPRSARSSAVARPMPEAPR